VIVPRPPAVLAELRELAYTLKNPSRRDVRQAISIDERRAMFR